MEDGKIFLTAADVAGDLNIDMQEAERVVRELNARVVQKGGLCIRGKVSAAFYQRMKNTGFTSPEGKMEARGIAEKRLLNIREFCFYSGMQRKLAGRLAKEIGIEKRIGRRVMYDRIQFDKWCDGNDRAL